MTVELSSIFPPLRVTHPRYPCPVPTHCRIWAFPPQNNSMYIYSTSEKAWELLSFFAWGTVNGCIMIYLSVKPNGLWCFWTAGSYPRARLRARQLHPLQHCDEICPLSADSINCVRVRSKEAKTVKCEYVGRFWRISRDGIAFDNFAPLPATKATGSSVNWGQMRKPGKSQTMIGQSDTCQAMLSCILGVLQTLSENLR